MAKNRDILRRLSAAAEGHSATNGPNAPNLFAEAKEELDRLYAIEADVETLFRPVHEQGDRKHSTTWTTTLEAATQRLEAGERLGIAVGAIRPKGKRHG